MDRKNFLKKVCTYGACGCAAMTFMPSLTVAEATTVNEDDQDWRIGFMQKRMAKHIEHLGSKLDPNTMNEVIEMLGRDCSNIGIARYSDYQGNIKGFLEEVITKWGDKAEYDEENGVIKIIGKQRDSCFCPFVDKKFMSVEFCSCSLGWQKNTYETILGKKVDATMNETILKGSDRCCFTITILS